MTSEDRIDRNGASLEFTHDPAGRLTEVLRTGGGASFDLPDGWGFDFDKAENLLARETRRSTRVQWDQMPLDGSGRNRPGSVDGVTLEWDANGNLTRKGDRTFVYDYRNRLTEVHDGTGLVASYTYDAFNRRVEKTVGVTSYETVWAGWQELEEYRAGTLASRRAFGLGLDEMVRVEADVEGDGVMESTYYPVFDSSGSLAMVLKEDGEPIELYAYSPFGERRVIVNDLTPPTVDQVRVAGEALVLELSEEVDTAVLEAAVAEGSVTLTDTGTTADVPFDVFWPVQEGTQARKRARLVAQSAPAAGTVLELSIAAGALEDLFGNAPATAITESLTWPAGDAVVRDTTAPRVESVSLQQGSLVVVLSEATTSSAAAAAIDLDGQGLNWVLGADGYTLTSQETVAAGSHALTIGTGALDLAGLGLAQTFQETFLLAEGETDRPVYERTDPTLSSTSTIGNRYGFHGRPVDPETGLLYFRNRYYDPELGRFVTSDPMGYVDGPNTYQYALNNPMAFSDPLGLCEGGWDENGEICGPTLEEFGEFGKGLGKGLWNRAKDMGMGVVDAVLHPVETAEDLVGVLVDPSSVSDALETGLLSVAKGLVSSDPAEVGDAVAGVVFDPAVALVTGGTVAAVATVSKVAHRATRVARGARVARAARWGRRADAAGSKFRNYSNHGGEFLDDALRFDGPGGGAPRRLVRESLPELRGSYADAFEGPIRTRTFRAGDRLYRSPNMVEGGLLERTQSPGPWWGTRRTVTRAGTESQYNVRKWGNPLDEMRAYEFTEDVTVYYGRVAGGKGYQVLFPRDVDPATVLGFVEGAPLR